MDTAQQQLKEYTESKRAEFPFFYFLADAELLEILSVGADPRKALR